MSALLLGLLLTRLVLAYARARGLVDEPGPRRSHDVPVPRGGGLAIALALLPLLVLSGAREPTTVVFVASALVIVVLGWADDHRPLPVAWRLGIQTVLAVAAVVALGPVEKIVVAGHELSGAWLWSALAVVALVWIVNLFNFMDGADGLAATQAIISHLLFFAVFAGAGEPGLAWIALLVACATTGFLFWNRPRATIFLGDSGSLLLGWSAAFLALAGAVTGVCSIWLSFVIISPFVVDATATLAWRVARGRRWYTPHRDHAYQFLIRAGWSHRRVLVHWVALNGLLVAPAALLANRKPLIDSGVAAAVGIILLGAWYVVHFVVVKERMTT
ncbi:MAG: glycosyltransferase family 4 protein [Wenzhouxiangellaceae bacterium]|nr:glycosyltransferase family 4 protein [Wenzhouxiangellaceae bacterium]